MSKVTNFPEADQAWYHDDCVKDLINHYAERELLQYSTCSSEEDFKQKVRLCKSIGPGQDEFLLLHVNSLTSTSP